MSGMSRVIATACVAILVLAPVSAQDAPTFGFGDADAPASGTESSIPDGAFAPAAAASSVRLSGELSAGASAFVDELSGSTSRETLELGDLFSGVVNLSVSGAMADGYLSLEAENPETGDSPFVIDEAYVRAYLGKTDIEAGLRKLAWGRADSQGPLDVVNPQDQSDLTVVDEMERKIARPLVRVSRSLAPMTRVEAVLLPSFEGEGFATDGRWVPGKMIELEAAMQQIVVAYAVTGDVTRVEEESDGLGHWQAGLRFTTTVGSVDLGAQYFYGYLKRPAVKVTLVPGTSLDIETLYNRYHQIGLDCATVLAGTNLRAELGVNLTEDMAGDDPSTYNPSIVWSLGFDRDVIAGLNLNLQGTGSVRLMDGGVGEEPFDFEDGTDMTRTRITAVVSKKLFRDELELKTTAIFGVEDGDYYLIPAASWTRDDLSFELSTGVFGGRRSGELGCYDDNDYLKASVTVSF